MFSKFVSLDALKIHSRFLSVLRCLCKTFTKLLYFKFILRNPLLRGWFFKKFIYSHGIQIKYLSGYKLVRAAKRSEKMQLKVQKEWHEAQHSRDLLHVYINENAFVDSFFFRFYFKLSHCLSLLSAFLSTFLSVCHFEIIRCILKSLIATSTYFCWNTRKLEKSFLGAQTGISISQTAWIRHCIAGWTPRDFLERNIFNSSFNFLTLNVPKWSDT